MIKTPNAKTVVVKITRGELIDLLISCTVCSENVNNPTNKWNKLHDKLVECLNQHDKKEDLQ